MKDAALSKEADIRVIEKAIAYIIRSLAVEETGEHAAKAMKVSIKSSKVGWR